MDISRVADLAAVDTVPMAVRIERLEADLRAAGPVDLPVKSHFAKGVYARELFIPKGTILTGCIHKFTNLNIMSQGDMSVLTENGIERIQAPFTIVSPPGTKRVAYAHEDTIWTTIHGTDETDVEKIKETFVTDSYEKYLEFTASLQLEGE